MHGDEAMYRFTGGSAPTLEQLRDRIVRQTGPTPEGTTWLNWVVRADGVAVGTVQATVVGDGAEVAWEVGVPWQGHGYASEAATAMVDHLVRSGVRPVTANIHPDHAASQRVATAAGLQLTADWIGHEQVWSRP
jgi:RimJ/RimL family protein N-acetyltransferase